MMLSKDKLLERLSGQISEIERTALREQSSELAISQYNRETVLRMLSCRDGYLDQAPFSEEDAIDDACVEGLTRALEAYLSRYMSAKPEGHKWIILSCLFLAFIAGEPMHPQAIVHWKKKQNQYRCPAMELVAGSICQWCVCGQAWDRRVCCCSGS